MPVKILGVEIDQVTFHDALERVVSFVERRRPHQIVTINAEFIMRAQTDQAFKRVLNHADLAVADGSGPMIASRYLDWLEQRKHHKQPKNNRLPELIPGSDLVPAIAELAAAKGWKLYLLGGRPGIAARAATALTGELPNLKIVGAEGGSLINNEGRPINQNQKALTDIVLKRIKRAKPDILFVAFGAPKQDRFIERYLEELDVPVMIGVGGTFDFLAGVAKRAPWVFRAFWLEWLWRLLSEPWRIKRIWTAVVLFPLAVLFKKG